MIVILSLFFIFSINVFGITLIAEETFQDFSKTLIDNPDVYDSMLDESQSDSKAESTAVIIGRSTNYKETVLLLYDISETNYINTLELNMTGGAGVPYNMNFLYNIYICRSTTNTLTNNNDIFYDCVSDLELVAENWNMSYWLGSTTGIKTIYLEQQYYLETGKHYNIIFEYVSGDNTINQYYSNSFDTNPSSNYYKTVLGKSSSSVSSAIIDFRLYYSRDNSYQLRGESDYKWDCFDSADYPDCKSCIGSGNCNSGLGNNLGEFTIEQTDSNKYLKLFTNKVVLGGSGGYEDLDLKYILNDSFDFDNINDMSLQYDVRINDILFSQVQPSSLEQLQTSGGLLNIPLGDLQSMTGHFLTQNKTLYSKLRVDFVDTLSSGKPINTDCSVSDGEWHRVTHHYHITDNAVKNINYTETYIDGNLCNNYTIDLNVGSGIAPLYFRFKSIGIFDIDFDNIRFFDDGFVIPTEAQDIELTHLICPITNCIYYDSFDYENTVNLFEFGYSGLGIDSLYFDDSVAYFNSSNFTKLPIIAHNTLDNSYNNVISLAHFNIKRQETPAILENRSMAFRVTANCKDTDSPLFTYNVYLSRNDDFTYSGNRTVVNLFSLESGKNRLLGTFTAFNGDYFEIKTDYDLDNQKAKLNIFLQSDIEQGYTPDTIFTVPMNYQCSNIGAIEFGRRDIFNTDVDLFAGLGFLWMAGKQDDITVDGGIDFIYSNETTNNESIVKKDIGEMLHNSAFSLGFKTWKSKLLFWSFIMVFVLAILQGSSISDSAKGYSTVGVFLLFFVAGFYLNFIPTAVFIMGLFVMAILGALVYMKLFSSSSGG